MRALAILGLLIACGDRDLTPTAARDTTHVPDAPDADADFTYGATTPQPLAFFYQDVASGGNRVRVGRSQDGMTVTSHDVDVAAWTVLGRATQVYGDPVMSLLPSGRWALTANTSPADPRGAFALLYHEAACPVGFPAPSAPEVRAIVASDAPGCREVRATIMAKTSQVFAHDRWLWLVVSNDATMYLLKLAELTTGPATPAQAICFLPAPASSLDALAVGDATPIVPRETIGPIGDDGTTTGPLLLSDAAIAHGPIGWRLFVKGIDQSLGCAGGGLCELCHRGVFLTTSDDLLAWSPLTRVAYRASVPEATARGGEVFLTWQDFTATCAADDLRLGARAPIMVAREQRDGTFTPPAAVTFPDEPFETDARLHYPTNANPVALPDRAARAAFDACLSP